MALIDPKETIEVLKKYSFIFSKHYGQNFLIDDHVLQKILRAAELTKTTSSWRSAPASAR